MNGEVNSKEFNLGRMDVGTYHYLNRMLEEFDGYEDFLNSYAFGKRPVEKEFQMILDQYFNKDLQEFYDYLKKFSSPVCEIGGRADVRDVSVSTVTEIDDLELDGDEVLNGSWIFEQSVHDVLCEGEQITDSGYVSVSDVSVNRNFLKLNIGVRNSQQKDIIYVQERL